MQVVMEVVDFQEVKSKVDIVDVVSQYVKLKREGNYYSGICPFHPDRNPSLAIYPNTQKFYCFGCGARGDVIEFVSKIEGIKKKEATILLERIATSKPKLPKPSDEVTIDYTTNNKKYNERYIEAYIEECYKKYLNNRHIINVFDFRCIPEELVYKYHLGFDAYSRDIGKGKCCMVLPLKEDERYVGYVKRFVSGKPRYINSNKKIPFNIDILKSPQEEIFIVEGIFDALSVEIIMGEPAIALNGLGYGYLLKRINPNKKYIIMLDNDEPGRNASQKLYEELRKMNIDCEVYDWKDKPVKDMNEWWMMINGRVVTNDRR